MSCQAPTDREQGLVRRRLIFAIAVALLRFGSEAAWFIASIGFREIGLVFGRPPVRSLSPHLERVGRHLSPHPLDHVTRREAELFGSGP